MRRQPVIEMRNRFQHDQSNHAAAETLYQPGYYRRCGFGIRRPAVDEVPPTSPDKERQYGRGDLVK